MCDCEDCVKEAKTKTPARKRPAKKAPAVMKVEPPEKKLYAEVFKVSPKNGDIICIVSPEGPLKNSVMANIKRMLDRMGLDRCIVLCLPDNVTLQTFDAEHEDLFAAMAGRGVQC